MCIVLNKLNLGGINMKKNHMKLVTTIMSVALMSTALVGCKADKPAASTETKSGVEEATISYLHCWGGAQGGFPTDQINNTVAKKIKEKTGVTINIKGIDSNETEKLNLMFASGDIPDLVNAPYWGTTGGEGKVIKKAASEGLLMELEGKLDNYPNVKRLLTVGVAKDFAKYDLNPPEYNGHSYIIPQQTPRSEADVVDWAYNVWVRKDILAATGVKAEEIDTSDKLYEFQKKVKAGSFKDVNGKAVIVSGTFSNGWDYGSMLKSFNTDNISDFRQSSDGTVTSWEFDPLQNQKVLFMRKLISEGLFDPEALTQADAVSKEKLATGRVAMLGSHYPAINDFMNSTLYKEHPEMQYVPVGPLKDSAGQPNHQLEKRGRGGFPAMFIGKDSENADAVLRVLDYLNSDEGIQLVYFGVEGKNFTMVDGKPQLTEEWAKKKISDPKAYSDEGLGFYANLIGSDPKNSLYPDKIDPNYEIAKKFCPVVFVDKMSVNYVARSYPKLKEYQDKIATLDWNKEFNKACFAKTDAEAIKILDAYRAKLKAAGVDDYTKYVQEQAKGKDELGF